MTKLALNVAKIHVIGCLYCLQSLESDSEIRVSSSAAVVFYRSQSFFQYTSSCVKTLAKAVTDKHKLIVIKMSPIHFTSYRYKDVGKAAM